VRIGVEELSKRKKSKFTVRIYTYLGTCIIGLKHDRRVSELLDKAVSALDSCKKGQISLTRESINVLLA
jgi:hypothetical protein